MMKNKQVLSTVLAAIIVLTIATSMVAATDDGGCSINSSPEVRPTDDPLSNRIDDILDETPVFLFFYADWCPYCHQQMPVIDRLEGECAEEVAFIRINVTARPDHAAEFDVTALPAMVMVSGKEVGGYVREEISGFANKVELSAIIAPDEGGELGVVGDDVGVMAPLATSTTCDSCEDCTEKLKSGEYDVVTLTTDITDHGGSCIGLIMGGVTWSLIATGTRSMVMTSQ